MCRTIAASTIAASLTLVLFFTLAAAAQESRSEFSLQGTGFFTKSSLNNGITYDATETGGFLGTYRYHFNHWLSVEGAYGFDRNTQKYSLSSGELRIQSNINQTTAALIVGLPAAAKRRISPYMLLGGGALIFDPVSNQVNTVAAASSQTKGAFVYGAGMNYAILRRVSLRLEYRGLVYNAPDFGFGLTQNSITHTAEPSAGLAFRF